MDRIATMSESTEMYLLTIYKLALEHGRVGNSQMANRLGVSTASITEMVKKLAEKGLVERKGRGVYLRPKGERIALRVLRKHRLAERLLTDHLKVRWDHAHEQSCRLEHILSDVVVDALEKFLGKPATCPHGHPIPDREGRVEIPEAPPLAEFPQGAEVEVVRVSEESLEVLRYLDEINLKPGRRVFIEQVAPFDGPLLLRVDGNPLPMSRSIARKIWVREVPPAE